MQGAKGGATLERLVSSIREVVSAELDISTTGTEVALRLAPYLGDPRLLLEAQAAPGPDRYAQHVLHVEPGGSFSIVALVWQPGQTTPIHDHVSWCVAGVHEGYEMETRYRLAYKRDGGAPFLLENRHSINQPGSISALTPPGDIHRVSNSGPGKAVSIHVYGADIRRLGSSVRRSYELEVRRAGAEPLEAMGQKVP